MAIAVPFTGGQKESLHASLNRHRAVVRWKLTGIGEQDARRAMTPSGMSPLGLVKHLGSVEYGWFCSTFGRPSGEIEFDRNDPDADWRPEPDETMAGLLDYYVQACAAADETIAALDLTDTGRAWHGADVSLRWVLIHMIEETARHCGHLDVMRELLDGAVGDHPE